VRRVIIGASALAVALLARPGAALPTKDECINANEAAQSHRRGGHLRAAASELATCTAASCPGPVRDDCTERLDEVDRAMPTVVFAVGGGSSDLTTVRVTVDGAPFASKLDGAALPVDPGAHTFAFAADGYAPVEETLVIQEGEKARVVRVVLQANDASGDVAAKSGAEGSASHASAERALSYVALGVGAAGVVVGGIFGGVALSDKNALAAHCSGDACPRSEQADIDQLHSNSLISSAAFGVGLAGLAAGIVLYWVSREPAPASAAGSARASCAPFVRLGGAGMGWSF
jgi:hypothetical protein